MTDFDELMDENECINCGGNGWECRCTPNEIEECEKEMQSAFDHEHRKAKKAS